MYLAPVGLRQETTISLAVNEWGGKSLAPRKPGLPGLAYYVIEVAHKEELLSDC